MEKEKTKKDMERALKVLKKYIFLDISSLSKYNHISVYIYAYFDMKDIIRTIIYTL